MTDQTPKLCECGCGEPAPISPRNHSAHGYVKGEARRFVHGHNTRVQPIQKRAPIRPVADRLWSRVDKHCAGGCWEWQGTKQVSGHGTMGVAKRNVLTHRLAYELTYGPIPAGKIVRHACDNPPCCNPSHLLLGVRADNSRDMVERERQERGARHHNAKLTEADIFEIRRLASAGCFYRDIAARFHIHQDYVYQIARRKVWRHI